MKVKILACSEATKLEEAINSFIKGKKVIDIKFQSLVYATKYNEKGNPCESDINDRVLVIYEDMPDDTFTLTKSEVAALNRYVNECLSGGVTREKK